MQTSVVKELYKQSDKYIGGRIRVVGWVRTVRVSKTFGFIELNDGSFFANLQVVFEEKSG